MRINGKPETHDKTGFPTAYGLHCGYVALEDKDDKRTRLWAEHSTYHVRTYATQPDMGPSDWAVYHTYSEAKREYKKRVRHAV